MTPARGKRFLLLTAAAVLSVVLTASTGCEELERSLFRPKIEVRCPVLQKKCVFTNHGDPGESCVEVQIHHLASGRIHHSKSVCSGRLSRDEPRWVDIEYPDFDPGELCMGEDFGEKFESNCRVEIVDIEQ